MIILEFFLFILSIIIFSISIAGLGNILSSNIKSDFFSDIFLGFIIISTIITIFHFFYEVEIYFNLLVFLIGVFIFFKKKNILSFKIPIQKKEIFYILTILFLIPMFISQKYHEDFGYYHLPYALAFLEEKIVFGFSNIDKSFVYNSIWLNLYSFFFLEDKNYNFLTFPSFLLFIIFILFSMDKILKKKKTLKISDYYLIVVLFYFLLKFTRISEFGVDYPASIFAVLSIFYFFKFYETSKEIEKKSFFYFNLAFSFFSILIKLSSLPIIILPVYLYFSNFKKLKLYIFNTQFLLLYFLGLVFFIQQFIYTGCFLFPSNFTCLNVSWFNFEYLNLSSYLELVNKSYATADDMYSPEDYLKNLTWLSFWFKRNIIEIFEHLLTIILPSLIFLSVLKKNNYKTNTINRESFIYFFCFVYLFFWLNFSPVVRFAIPIFLTLIFIIFSRFFIEKKISINILLIFIFIFLMFNFSKNIMRIKDTEKVFLGIEQIENKYLLNKKDSNKHANIYYPDIKKNIKNGWQGRLCWDIPFICSYNKLEVSKKNGYLILNKIKN
tara:strand:+ start:36737 stop:38392 length:1656 start_codon:yes stop_codon:yes gene_type:complete